MPPQIGIRSVIRGSREGSCLPMRTSTFTTVFPELVLSCGSNSQTSKRNEVFFCEKKNETDILNEINGVLTFNKEDSCYKHSIY